MPANVSIGQVVGEYLGFSFAKSLRALDIVNKDKNDGKISFVAKDEMGVFLEDRSGNGARVDDCVLDSKAETKDSLSFGCKRKGEQAFGKLSSFTDATKIKIALAALGENIGAEFVKSHFQEIEALKAKFTVKAPKASDPTKNK